MDFRPGGRFSMAMRGPDGNDFPFTGVYREIVPPATLSWTGEFASGPADQMTTVVTFEAQGQQTVVHARQTFHVMTPEIERATKGAQQGWTMTLDQLAEYLDNQPLVIERRLNAPIQQVWRALTDKDHMKQWYFDLAEFKPEVGFEFQFYAGKDEKQYLHLCKITEVIPGKKITYSWRYDGYEGNSLVTFELFAEGDCARLRLTHTGVETFPKSNPDLAKENFVQGWTSLIGTSLKKFLEQ